MHGERLAGILADSVCIRKLDIEGILEELIL